MTLWRRRLKEQFRDRVFRETFATEHLNSSIALQLTVIREQRHLKQEQLAELAGTKQAGISRMESADYGRWNLQTLRHIAYLLGCRLRVSLETFGTLLDEAEEMSRSTLQRHAFEEDPVFQNGVEANAASQSADPVEWMRELVLPYLDGAEPDPARMTAWLSGEGLPPVGDEEDPYLWIARALPKSDAKTRNAIVGVLDKLLNAVFHRPAPDNRYIVNLLRLTAEVGEEAFSHTLAARLNSLYDWLSTKNSGWRRAELSAFRDALVRHQRDNLRVPEWFRMIKNDRHEFLPGTAVDGFRGLCYVSGRPNLELMAEGLRDLGRIYWDELDYDEILAGAADRFQFGLETQDKLFVLSIEKQWTEPLLKAWAKTFAGDDQARRAVADTFVDPKTVEGAVLPLLATA